MPQVMKKYTMSGTGIQNIEIPSGLSFVSIMNDSINTIEVYDDTRTVNDRDPNAIFVGVQALQSKTIPLSNSRYYTVIWVDGGSFDSNVLTLIFSDQNLNINGQGIAAGSLSNTVITADNIGLAKQAQFPSSLTAGGNLKVEVLNTSVPVSVGGNVEIVNDVGNPIPVSGTLAGISGTVNIAKTWQGTQGAPWGSAAVGAAGASSSVDLAGHSRVAIFGQASATTTIGIEVSVNGTNWYQADTIAATAATNFYKLVEIPTRYVRLTSSAAATITATIAAKS